MLGTIRERECTAPFHFEAFFLTFYPHYGPAKSLGRLNSRKIIRWLFMLLTRLKRNNFLASINRAPNIRKGMHLGFLWFHSKNQLSLPSSITPPLKLHISKLLLVHDMMNFVRQSCLQKTLNFCSNRFFYNGNSEWYEGVLERGRILNFPVGVFVEHLFLAFLKPQLFQ